MAEDDQKTTLNIVTVHGTFDGKYNENQEMNNSHRWYYETSEFSKTLRESLESSYKILWTNFNWSGKNQESERLKASRKLRDFLIASQDTHVNTLLLSHSHGGNVVLKHLKDSPLFHNTKAITFGTPFVHVKSIRSIALLKSIAISAFLIYVCISILVLLWYIALFISTTKFEDSLIVILGAIILLAPVVLLCRRYWSQIENQTWVIWWRDRKKLKSLKKVMKEKKYLHLIYHNEDEAIAALTNDSFIEVPFLFYRKTVNILSWMLLFVTYGSLFYILREAIDVTQIAVIAVIFTPIFIGISYYLFKLPLIWIGNILNKPAKRIVGKNLTNRLRRIGRGADTGSDIFMDSHPDIAPSNYIDLSSREELKKVFVDIKNNADINLINRKSILIERLMQSRGNLLEVISPPAGGSKYPEDKLTDALIHCNYFTSSMGNYLAKYIKTLY